MERKLLKILKLADLLNERQDNVYAQIRYTADKDKVLEVSIRSKKDYSYIQQCKIELKEETIIRLDDIISLFESYIGGVCSE